MAEHIADLLLTLSNQILDGRRLRCVVDGGPIAGDTAISRTVSI